MTTKTAHVFPQTGTDDTIARPDATAVDVGQALRIDVDGSIDTIDLARAQDGSYGTAICEAIGCRRYTIVDVDAQTDMWIDDEGMPDLGDVEMVTATLNPLATLLLAEHREIYQPYFGVALFTGRDGERTTGLVAAHAMRLRTAAEAIASRPAHLEAFRQRVIAAVTRRE